MSDTESNRYVRGATYARRDTPTFEFKAGATGYTGGGYARVRSKERRPDKPGDDTWDTFASIHRLAAVVWCYDSERDLADIQRDMVGRDVHHTLGMPSANGAEFVELRDHAEHSGITNTQRRAWGEDAKRARDGQITLDEGGDTCAACDSDVRAAVGGERYCLECATEHADGEPIEVL